MIQILYFYFFFVNLLTDYQSCPVCPCQHNLLFHFRFGNGNKCNEWKKKGENYPAYKEPQEKFVVMFREAYYS